MVRFVLVVLVVSVAVAVAGCGSGGGAKKASTRAPGVSKGLTQRQFASQANAICKAYYTKFNRLKQPQSLAQVGPYVDKAAALIEGELSDLKALVPPGKFQSRYRTFLASGTQELQLARQLGAAAKAGNAAKVRALIASGQRMDAHANALAKGLGLSVCAQSSATG